MRIPEQKVEAESPVVSVDAGNVVLDKPLESLSTEQLKDIKETMVEAETKSVEEAVSTKPEPEKVEEVEAKPVSKKTKEATVEDDRLKDTPFRNIDDLKKSWKDMQDLGMKTMTKNQKLEAELLQLKNRPAPQATKQVFEEGTEETFLTRPEVERLMAENSSKIQNEVTQETQKQLMNTWVQVNKTEAEKNPDWYRYGSEALVVMAEFAQSDYYQTDNPFLTCLELAKNPDLRQYFRENTKLLGHLSFDDAKAIIQARQAPAEREEALEEAEENTAKRKLAHSKARVATSSNTASTPSVNINKMSAEELKDYLVEQGA